jgi:hypothetical protein
MLTILIVTDNEQPSEASERSEPCMVNTVSRFYRCARCFRAVMLAELHQT